MSLTFHSPLHSLSFLLHNSVSTTTPWILALPLFLSFLAWSSRCKRHRLSSSNDLVASAEAVSAASKTSFSCFASLMFAATNAESVPKVRLLGLDFRPFRCMDKEVWRMSGLEVVMVVVRVIIGAWRGGLGRDREGVWEMGTLGRGRTISAPLRFVFLSTCSSEFGVFKDVIDRLLLFRVFAVFSTADAVSLNTNSGGIFSPIILCNLAIFIRFSLSDRPRGGNRDVTSWSDEGDAGKSRSEWDGRVCVGKWNVLIGDKGPRIESTLSCLRSNGVTSGGAGTWIGVSTWLARVGIGAAVPVEVPAMLDRLQWWSTGTADILNSNGCARGCGPPFFFLIFFSLNVSSRQDDGDFCDVLGDDAARPRWESVETPGLGWVSSEELESSELTDDENGDLKPTFLLLALLEKPDWTTCGVVPRRASSFLAVRTRRARWSGSIVLSVGGRMWRAGCNVDMEEKWTLQESIRKLKA